MWDSSLSYYTLCESLQHDVTWLILTVADMEDVNEHI